MINKRDVALAIVFTVITCGIYGIYWFIVLTDDVKTASGEEFQSGGIALLLTIITCGIYGFYWAYKMGELMKKAQEKRNMPVKDNAVLYLILEILGLGIVNYAMIQSDLNAIADMTSTNQGA